ncbi:class A beta-lactamase-related serine hydrolase [Streptomyces sp. NBC_00237]|uniref:serine hydrolase n=1 Tax=Streptomyces sp. NBC_00237 TaxID=2975687 RepID=UPI0022565312|nr:serine hydrolase [Streptomyces sp. NBC_00237]MCX5205437.1 class A beta-lactamase-related serine hydrolase [Streptomyces sp. NBC_00237]
MSGAATGAVRARLRAVFADAGVTGQLHALDLDSGAEVGIGADALVSTASTHKLCLAVAVRRLADAGHLDPKEQVEVPVHGRTAGGTGVAMLRDPVRMSLRDLLALALTVSDNAAADVLYDRVGLDGVNRAMAALGLTRTVAVHTGRDLLTAIDEDCGGDQARLLVDPGLTARLRVLDPERTNRSTPRELTRLLAAVWHDEACAPEGAAELRSVLAHQVWPHRLASGFPFDDVRVAGKTGTLPTLRHEVGVVEYPDGGRYAVAVFTRAARTAANQPAADAAIGTAARLAVESLRVPPRRGA